MDCGEDHVFGNDEGGADALFIVLPAHDRSVETEEVVLLQNNDSSKYISFDE